ncbi:MFS transporter, PPP family, 3-phenylpropionic acid transporter [Paenibacillus algorifonticola]|uniref:MFS transporter, PPP family, 3-phenylpropionic acid transporter n=1 Tax=Paenibacillus algorifonticola TaxID=684063 RepID=A0A1I2A9U0_9BACL|nr:MFS transporter [Paenibacillus algorifonticola]SFE40348.1 MFS transporter, PPP family, 3-phenylpropionic acid transporter [Paenibacillus algorifonticola]
MNDAKKMLLKLRALYLFTGLAGGLFNPYLTTLLVHQGMSAGQVGMMMSLGTLLSIIVQPFWGYMVDRYRQTKLVLVCSIGMPAVLAYFYNVQIFALLVIVYTTSIIFSVTQSPIADSYAVTAAREGRTSYGTIRSLGSLGTALGGYAGGLYLSYFHITQLWLPFFIFSAAGVAMVLTLSNKSDSYRTTVSLTEGFKQMLSNRNFLWFLVACFFVNQTLTAYNSFFVLSFQEAGGSFSMVGFALLLASMTNVPSMLLTAKIIAKLGRERTLVIAAFAYALRWAVQWLFPYPPVMIGIQALHGLSFGLFYVAAVEYVASVSGKEMQATGQSVFNMVFVGLGGIIGNLLNGFLYNAGGAQLMYLACTVSAIMGLLLLHGVNKRSCSLPGH